MGCLKRFEDILGYQFITKLDNKRKIHLIQIYLGAGKLTVKYTDIKKAVQKRY